VIYLYPDIYVFRHAATRLNPLYVQGHTDEPLSNEGIKQAKLEAEKKPVVAFDANIASPSIRAYQTLALLLNPNLSKESLATFRDDRIIVSEAFNERNMGHLERELRSANEPILRYYDEHIYEAPDGGESYNALIARVQCDFSKIIENYAVTQQDAQKNVRLVIHAGPIRAILGYCNNIPRRDIPYIKKIDNAEMIRCSYSREEERWFVFDKNGGKI